MRGEYLTQRVDVAVEEEEQLQLGGDTVRIGVAVGCTMNSGPLVPCCVGPRQRRSCGPTAQDVLECFEHEDEPCPTGVVDAGLGENLELVGGIEERLAGSVERGVDDLAHSVTGLMGRARTVGGLAQHGENRAFHGRGDGGLGKPHGVLEHPDQRSRVDRPLGGGVREGAEYLAQHHSGVPACPLDRPRGQQRGDGWEVRVGGVLRFRQLAPADRRLEFLAGGADGVGHVRPGVGVRDGEHVDAVDFRLRFLEQCCSPPHPMGDGERGNRFGHACQLNGRGSNPRDRHPGPAGFRWPG